MSGINKRQKKPTWLKTFQKKKGVDRDKVIQMIDLFPEKIRDKLKKAYNKEYNRSGLSRGMKLEAWLQYFVVWYLTEMNIPYIANIAGINLQPNQRSEFTFLGGRKGISDLFLPMPSKDGIYSGLFLELKMKNVRMKNGEFYSKGKEHHEEQDYFLTNMESLGYKAVFAYPKDVFQTINKFYSL